MRPRGQCGEDEPVRGSVIRHAGAVRALVIAMIEAAFGTALIALSGSADRRLTRRRATRGRALRVLAIATRRSQRRDYSVDRLSDEAAHPRRRSSGALRLDTALKPWHKKDDWLGPAKHRGGHRGSGDLTSRPSSRPTARPPDYQQSSDDFEGALGGSCSPALV